MLQEIKPWSEKVARAQNQSPVMFLMMMVKLSMVYLRTRPGALHIDIGLDYCAESTFAK